MNFEKYEHLYDKYYKLILLIPIIFLLICVGYLYNFQNQNGDIIYKDVTLTGGTTVTVFDTNVNLDNLRNSISKEFPDALIREISDFRTGAQNGFILETKSEVAQIKPALEDYLGYDLVQDNSSIEFSGATLSQGFYKQLRTAVFLAFLFMAIAVFIIFRTPVPSLAVIISAFADIVMTIVVVNIFGVTLSTAGIIAFLLLIGYSVDTDILLTTRVVKKKEDSINHRIFGAFKTGMTMTLTSIAAVGVAYFLVRSTSDVLSQIFFVLLIGLVFDIFNTWLTNASIIKWYAEHKENGR